MRGGIETNSRKLIALLQADGWEHVATKGDHWQFKHPTRPGRVTVPHPVKDLKPGTALSIYRQAGWR
jgi:predicted RNA binding protein YcfA (HicA-like mRNA interferase family)